MSNNKKERPWDQCWARLCILAWMIVLCASCTQSVKEGFFRKSMVRSSGHASVAQARLQEALHHLQSGRNSTAGEILTELASPRGDTSHEGPASEFYLGLVKLLEMDNLQEMEMCKRYFEGYIEKYPSQPYQANAARIARLLKKHIALGRKEGRRVKELNQVVDELNQVVDELNRVVNEQAKEIHTLKYQMEKLEEIQLETERRRQSLELEEAE